MTGKPPGRPQVLVVDDEEGMRDTLADIFEELEYSVERASNGREAVERVRSFDYALVLMDIRMPEGDGVEALRAIREVRPGLPVFMMTAGTETGMLSEATYSGAEDVFRKPLDLDRLLCMINTALRVRGIR